MTGSEVEPVIAPDAELAPPWWRSRRGAWLLAVLPLVLWQVAMWAHHTIDDAGITFAYIDTWLHGGGLAFRPGDPPVEAYSNALWLFILTPFAGLGLDLEVVSKVLGVLFGLVTAGGIYTLALRIERARPWTALLGPLVLWGAPLYGFWVLSGLENGLFTMLLVLMVLRANRDAEHPGDRWTGQLPSALLQAAVVMTRPDGILYVVAVQLWLLVLAARRRRSAAPSAPLSIGSPPAPLPPRRLMLRRWLQRAALAAGLYLAYFALRYAYFGTILPNSFHAKSPTQSGSIHLLDFIARGWRYVLSGYDAYAVAVPLALALVLAFAWRPARRLATLAVACLGVGLLFPIIAGGDWMNEWRMLSFSWPFVALLLALGAGAAVGLTGALVTRLSNLPPTVRRLSPPAVGALVVLAAVLYFRGPWNHRAVVRAKKTNITVSDVSHRADFYQYVANLAGLDTPRVADVDAGGTTWKRHVGFLDLGKLGDLSFAAHFPKTYGHLRNYVFHEDRPDLIHLHGGWHSYKLHNMAEWREMYAPILRAHSSRFDHVFGDNVIAVAPFVVPGPELMIPKASGWDGPTPTPGGLRLTRGGLDLAVVAGDLHHAQDQGQTPLTWELVGRTSHHAHLPDELHLVPCDHLRAGSSVHRPPTPSLPPRAHGGAASTAPSSPAGGGDAHARGAADETSAPATKEPAHAAPPRVEARRALAPTRPLAAFPRRRPSAQRHSSPAAARRASTHGHAAAADQPPHQLPGANQLDIRVKAVWAAGIFQPRALAQRAWVTGVASTPVSPDLAASRCLALTLRQRGADEVLAVTTRAPAHAPLADGTVNAYLKALAEDSRVLLEGQRSPAAPPLARTLCTSEGLTDPGACSAWLRHGALVEGVREHIAETGAARARELLAAADAAEGEAREEALIGAGLWLVAARQAAGRIPVTGMDARWRATSEAVCDRLHEASTSLEDPLSNAGMRLLELAIRVDPSDNWARLDMEDRRPRAASRVRAIEWKLRQDLRKRLRDEPDVAAGAADAAALLASTARDGRLLEGWRCLAHGSCRAYRAAPTVISWAAWLDGVLGLGPAAPRPVTRREVWGFEHGQLNGFHLVGEAWGRGAVTGPRPGQQHPSGYEQNALLDSFHGGDHATGTAESRPFVIEDDFMGMLVGGGLAKSGVHIDLVVGGKAVLVGASPRRSPALDPVVWDVRAWKGRVATLRLVDKGKKSWGHLLVDAITWMR